MLLDLGRPAEAVEQFDAALEAEPQSLHALHNLGRALMDQGKHAAAIPPLSKASDLEPLEPEHQLMLGVAYTEAGLSDKAIGLLQKTVSRFPQSAEARMNLATGYARNEDYEPAAFEEVIRLDPENQDARLSLGKVRMRLHNYDDALAAADAYIAKRLVPFQGFDARHLRGVALRQLGRFEEAEQELTRAVELDPEYADAHYNLGFVLSRLGRLEPAREHLLSLA